MFLSASLLLVPRSRQTGRGSVSTPGPGVSPPLPASPPSLLSRLPLSYIPQPIYHLYSLFYLYSPIFSSLNLYTGYRSGWTSWLGGRGVRTDGAEHCLDDPLCRQVAAASTCINLIHRARALIDLLFRFID